MLDDDFMVQTAADRIFKRSELIAAFNKVADPGNWKNPICATIDAADKVVISDAVVFFTGSVPTFTDIGRAGCLVCTAIGYYAAVGS